MEARVSADAAELALYERDFAGGTMFLVYDSDLLINDLLAQLEEGDPEKLLYDAIWGSIKGFIYVHKPSGECGAREVKLAGARSGFGPLMYDIAMSTGPIMSDRAIVSHEAEKVWYFYRFKRPDVERVEITGCPLHKDASRPYLDFAYAAKSPIDVSGLRARHARAVEELFDLDDVFEPEMVEDAFYKGGTKFFKGRYGTVR